MRSFFWLLVVVNLAYFGWRLFGPELVAPSAAPEVPAAPSPSLTLLSELPEPPQPRAATTFPSGAQAPAVPEAGETAPPTAVTDEPAPALDAAQTPVERSRVCAVVAGFTASDSALALVQTLQQSGIEAFTISGDEQAASVWWVYLPKFASEDLARRTLSELREKGIDSYYLSSGELQGGISLGVFSRQEGAVRTQEELARSGYSASILETSREAARYRVVVESTPDVLLAESAMQDFLERNPGLEVSDFVCEGVAEPK